MTTAYTDAGLSVTVPRTAARQPCCELCSTASSTTTSDHRSRASFLTSTSPPRAHSVPCSCRIVSGWLLSAPACGRRLPGGCVTGCTGTTLVCRYLSAEVFDGVSDYVITKPQLCGKLVTITAAGHKIMGYPLRVRNERYHRYALMFNVGMVFDEGADTRAYQGVLRKLGNTFHTMETESSFLLDPDKKVCTPATPHPTLSSRTRVLGRVAQARLRDILPAILNGLRAFGEVALPVDAAHTLFLRIFEFMPPPPPVADHEVGVRACAVRMTRTAPRTLLTALAGGVRHGRYLCSSDHSLRIWRRPGT